MNDAFRFRNTKSCKNPKPPRTGSLKIVSKSTFLWWKCGHIPGEQGTAVEVPIKTEDVRVTGISVLSTGDSMYTSISAGHRDDIKNKYFC
jgi:hypothetical protein